MASAPHGVVSVAEAADLVRADQAQGRVVVMCHGCFDIVHPGHIRHLRQAAELGDRLLVTVTGDAAMDKGKGRPLIPQELRAENLAALDVVDWVAIGDGPTAVELLETIRPDIYVKGREYETAADPRFERERSAVEAAGGRVVFTSGEVVFSSTALIETMEHTAHFAHATLRGMLERPDLDPAALAKTLQSMAGRRVLVVGETIVDTYVMCDRPWVAGEGPVMTLRPIEYRRFDGGAAIVARHAAALGARPILLTALPRTPEASALQRRLEAEGVEVHALPVDRGLAEKQRYLVGTTKVMKLDGAERLVLDATDRAHLVDTAARRAQGADAVIVADFGLGLLSGPAMEELCARVRPHVGVLAGDVSGRHANLRAMRDMDLLCPSENEIRGSLGAWDDGLSAVAGRLLAETESRAVLVTLGAEGAIAFGHALRGTSTGPLPALHVPALAPHAVDALGCGDALLAAASLALAAKGTLAQAALLGSLAAACAASKLGNAVVGAAQLRRGVRRIADMRLTWEPDAIASLIDTVGDTHAHVPAAHAQSS